MTTKESIAKCFTRMAAHHLVKARRAEQDGDEEMAAEHAETGAACAACAKDLGESMKADGGDELEPVLVSKVTPTAPSVRMVPRAGMQPVPDKQQNPVFTEVYGATEGGEQ